MSTMSAETLNQFVQNHSLARQMRERKADIVWDKFSHWLKSKPVNGSWHSALYRFASEAPFCYINPQIIDNTLAILNLDLQTTLEVLKDQAEFVSRAIFSFLRPTSSWQIQDGERVSINTPSGIEDFENIWHPEYVKYCEQVYNHIIKIPLGILGKQSTKDYLSLVLSLRAEKLIELGYPNLTIGFDSIIRNAISHGGIEYDISDIHYIDKRDKKEIYAPDVANLLDDLFDTCNSIIAATIIFVIENQVAIEKSGIENLPLGIKFLLADGFVSHSGSKLMSFIESGKGNQQLNINLKTNTIARGVHQLESLQTAWAICHFGGKKYDRFLVSVDCNMPVQPLAIINGIVLRDAIQNNKTLIEIAPNLFESSLLWYDTSKMNFRFYTLLSSFKTNWEIHKRKFRLEMTQRDTFIPLLHYKVVFSKNTSPRLFRRLEAHIVLDVSKEITDANLIKTVKSAINRLKRRLIKRKDIHGEFGLKGVPFSINLRVYATDKRVRKLISYSWQDEELVAIAEFSKNWEKAPPFYTKQADRMLNRIRIKYNPKLIKIKEN
jgi:hypothetical protein